jgi:(4-alkanoyl-5-oxo-2,5-dihydrofuran-3-yl)methyl phosphate reductase
MPDTPILVTGATGTIGSRVVEQLLERRRHVHVLTRDAGKAAQFGKGVEVVVGELGRPDTLAPAFSGIKKAFVLSSNNGGPDAGWESNAFQAAVRAGVDHIVKLSGRGVDGYNAGGFTARQQAQSEQELRALDAGWTILRPASSRQISWETFQSPGSERLACPRARERTARSTRAMSPRWR